MTARPVGVCAAAVYFTPSTSLARPQLSPAAGWLLGLGVRKMSRRCHGGVAGKPMRAGRCALRAAPQEPLRLLFSSAACFCGGAASATTLQSADRPGAGSVVEGHLVVMPPASS